MRELKEGIAQAHKDLSQKDKKLGLVVVDGWDESRVPDQNPGRALKQMAQKYEIPILVRCGLPQESLEQQDFRPQLNDLHESKSIELNSDLIWFVHRDEVYHEKSAFR